NISSYRGFIFMAEEEKEITSQEAEQTQTETTEKVDNSLEEDLKIFMSDVQGQIANLTQMIEKMNTVADEPAEEPAAEPAEEPEEKEEETNTDSEVEEILKDI